MGIKKTRRLGPTSTAVEFVREKRLNNGKNTHVRGINAHGRVDCGPAETVDECRDAGTAYVFLERPGGAGVQGVTPWSPPGQSLDLESSSGVREKEGTNSRMNSWTSGRGF